MFPTSPQELGGWKIGNSLGEGACGKVFEATKDGVTAAIKIFRHEAKLKKGEFNRVNLLANESNLITVTEKFKIPYLPKLYQGFATEDKSSYIVIELFRKGSLVNFLREASFTPNCVYGIGYRIVKCLQSIHTMAGWYHLDLKPENIMIRDDRHVGISLIDFGVSLTRRFTKLCPRPHLEGSYPFLGSHAWKLEPESPRDDLESVGFIMAWLLLDGKLPWSQAENLEEMKRQIVNPNTPRILSETCKSKVVEDYLLRVRRLGVEEEPNYDELMGLLKTAAGDDYVDKLHWTPKKPVGTQTPETDNIPREVSVPSPLRNQRRVHSQRSPKEDSNQACKRQTKKPRVSKATPKEMRGEQK
jgi:serine/threonine protein kinase